ncbi:MAG: glutamine synthetase type III, partial [Clostridia bacterium]|nr:glutamine synthetase type III [Clostridia bacterium]
NKVFTEAELRSRHEITLENYNKAVLIEANTMADMARREILPAVSGYCGKLAAAVAAKKAVLPGAACGYETETLASLGELTDTIAQRTAELEAVTAKCRAIDDVAEQGFAIRDALLSAMDALREGCDKAETMTAKEDWPFPTYGDLLFGV